MDEQSFHTFRYMKNTAILATIAAALLVYGVLYSSFDSSIEEQYNGQQDPYFSYVLCDGSISEAELVNYERIRGRGALSKQDQKSIATLHGVSWLPENLQINMYLDVTGSVLGFYDGSQMPLKIMRAIIGESEVRFWTFKDKVNPLENPGALMSAINKGMWSSSSGLTGLNGIMRNLKNDHPSRSNTTPLEDIIRDVLQDSEVSGELVVVLTDGLNTEDSHFTSGDFNLLDLSRTQLRVLSFPATFKGTWYEPGASSRWLNEQKNYYVIIAGSIEQMALFDKKLISESPFSSPGVIEVCNLKPAPVRKTPCYSLMPKPANAGGDLRLTQVNQSCFGLTYPACSDVNFGTQLKVEVDLSEYWAEDLHAANWEVESGFPFEVIDVAEIAGGGSFCKLATHVITLECPTSFGKDDCKLLLKDSQAKWELPQELGWMVDGLKKCFTTEEPVFVDLPLSISHF